MGSCNCSTEGCSDDTKKSQPNEAKVLAETAKIEVDIEEARARIEKERAEVEKTRNDDRRAQERHEQDLAALRLAVQRGALSLETDAIIRDRNRREENMILACDWNHHVYNFVEVVDADTVLSCMTQLNQWVRRNRAEAVLAGTEETPLAIEIIFDSPGGNVFDGMHLFDFIRQIRKQGHSVTTVALGNAASMAGILIQAGSHRVIGEESYILIHHISQFRFMDQADADELQDRIERLKKMERRVLNIFATRAADALVHRVGEQRDRETIFSETTALIEKEWKKRDWWVDSEEAYRYGFVDEIR